MTHPLNILNNEDHKEKPWYHEGLSFKCTQCGQCCTGGPGYAWVSDEEIFGIAEHLKISIEDFVKKYLRLVGDRFALLESQTTYDCIFLKDKKCQIYSVRPKQCQTFPWWIQNLKSEKEWEEAAKQCEGINHPEAPLISYETIVEHLNP